MTKSVHRKTQKLTSVRKHGFSALLLLALIGLSTFTWLQIVGKRVNVAANADPEFALSPYQTPQAANVTQPQPLPDLLKDDNIPLDVNPTDSVELLGGVETNQTSLTANTRSRSSIIEALADVTGPKIILIDGQPVRGNADTPLASPLIRAPIQGLTRMSPFGRMPMIAANGRTVLNSYAKPFTPIVGKSYTSIIIGGLGVNQALTQRAIDELPGEVSLAFAALTPNLQSWIDRARAKGHEALIELPMESAGFDATAPDARYTLATTALDSANIRNLDYLLSRAEGYFALTNYGGEVLVNNEKSLKPIVEHIKNAGLGFIYDGGGKGARIQQLGRKYALPIVTANQFLDETTRTREDVRLSISEMTAQKASPVPIGMGFSYGGTIDGVKDWLATKPANTELAPVSYALKTNL